MLKPLITHDKRSVLTQPPSGGCVLKLKPVMDCLLYRLGQPPSGGCVLKLTACDEKTDYSGAATFGWLCVETANSCNAKSRPSAATFGWLCVETFKETLIPSTPLGSHLRVAVC